MEDVLSRSWAQVKWEEDVASRAKAQPKQDQRSAQSDRGDQDERSSQKGSKNSGSRNRGRFQYRPQEKEEGMSVSTWPDISHLSISTPELVNTLRQMGQHVKLPPKMKAPDSFRNPELWCRFHHDHGHKTEDCIPLKIEVNELLQKGHLREFLSEKAKAHLSKETTGKSIGAAPASPPRQDRVIHVISGGSEVSGVSHAAAKKSIRNAKNGLEMTQPKHLLLGTDEISFSAKEQEKIVAPHHDALVISLTLANCLVKRILVNNGSSSNIIFQMAYQDLGLEESILTRKVTSLIGFSHEVKQTAGEVTLPRRPPTPQTWGSEVNDTRNWGSFWRSRTLDHSKNPRNPRRTDVDRSAWSPPKPFKVASARKTWSSQDPRPPPHIEKITKNLIRYQPVVSRVSEWGMSIPRRLPQRVYQTGPERRAPRRHRMEKLSQAGDLQTWSLQWMNVTTRFMETQERGRTLQKKEEPSSKDSRPKSKSRPAGHLATRGANELDQVQETFDPGQPLMISDVESSKVWHLGFHPHHHAARELDSDQLPSGRMRHPNRPQGQKPIWFPKKTSESKNHVSNSRPQGPEPTGSPKRPPGPKLIKTLQVTPGS
ncbi:hypothetical protein F2Q69_00013461 [Brassica cretica]|uniref:Retrotransposon gag domain-containing protein n=1 Tax=Brassica cretica TaxID=69181 RepID=A0A8S9QZG5_BRACR|nr:hypothetical protein F2Q69_00013461 [Brassica cretica]